MDKYDILKLTLERGDDKTLGLSLSQSVNKPSRSLSRNSTKSGKSSKSKKSKKEKSSTLPMITSIDPGLPADRAGLKPQDLILEINGKATNGENSKKVGDWIRGSGGRIEFLISREKGLADPAEVEQEINIMTDAQVRENARQIAEEALDATKDELQEAEREVEVNISERLSRKDSAQVSRRSNENSQPGTPKIVKSEIKMSSSRLHQVGLDDQIEPVGKIALSDKSPSSSYRSNRNHSEPAPLQQQVVERSSLSDINNALPATVTPLSTRSKSSFNIPHDAPVPRLCRVRAYEEQLGFTVSGSKTNKGVFKVNDVTPNSPAAHSGLINDDYIIEISGRPVENMDYNQVVEFIKQKKSEDDLQLLVADRPTLNWYKQKKIQISSQIIPKMQYIETLLTDELQAEAVLTPEKQAQAMNSE